MGTEKRTHVTENFCGIEYITFRKKEFLEGQDFYMSKFAEIGKLMHENKNLNTKIDELENKSKIQLISYNELIKENEEIEKLENKIKELEIDDKIYRFIDSQLHYFRKKYWEEANENKKLQQIINELKGDK